MSGYRFGFGMGVIGVILTGLSAAPVSAQSIWVSRRGEPSITLETQKPMFEGGGGMFITSASFLSLRAPVSGKVNVVADIPLSIAGYGSQSSATLGNPLLGVELGGPTSPHFVEFGVRLPLAREFGKDDFATGIGLLTDFDRFEAFLPDAITVYGMVNYVYRVKTLPGLSIRLRAGPTLLIARDGSGETLKTLTYSVQILHEGNRVAFGTGLSSRASLGEGFFEKAVYQLGLMVALPAKRIQPGIYVRLPLDANLSRVLTAVVGLNIGIALK